MLSRNITLTFLTKEDLVVSVAGAATFFVSILESPRIFYSIEATLDDSVIGAYCMFYVRERIRVEH